jgi:predicted aspartyl protease
MVNNLVVLPLRINGSDTLHFILDTGVNTTIVTNLGGIDSLMLPNMSRIELSGIGDGEPITAIRSLHNVVELDGLSGREQVVYILEQDIFHLSAYMGMEVHGLLGYSLFSNFVVEIDYSRKRLVFHDPKSYRPKRRAQVLPMSVERGKPYVEAKALAAGQERPVKLLIDTGASHALSFYTNDSLRAVPLPGKHFRAFLGRGLNGDVHGHMARIEGFELGGFSLKAPIATFPDPEAVALALELSDRDGSMGADLLKRFVVAFDYPRGRLLLTKGMHYYDDFTYNMSGIDLATPYPGMRFFQVSAVRKGSPAARAGVRERDELLEVNGKDAMAYSLNELVSLFRERSGKRMKLLVRRNGVVLKYEFLLEDDL